MADSKISDLAASTTPLAGTELAVIVQGGVTKQVAVSDLRESDNFATADLTLTGNRIHDTNSNNLILSTDGATLLQANIGLTTAVAGLSFGNTAVDVRSTGLTLFEDAMERVSVKPTETVINEAGGSFDFRVEGDTDTSLLFADASTDRVGVGTVLPLAKVDIHAQGALSTDIALNVRNSADTKDLFTVLGDGQVFSYGKGGVNSNTAYGDDAFNSSTTGVNNTAFGLSSLSLLTTGQRNIGIGNYALNGVNSGDKNVAIGHATLFTVSSGDSNVAVGTAAGRYISGGVTNNTACGTSIFIGQEAFPLANSQTNQIVIGDTAVGNGSNTTTLGNSSTVSTHLKGVVIVGEYTVATLPTASTYQAGMIMISDETGGYTMAFSDGTNWRRTQDRAIVS